MLPKPTNCHTKKKKENQYPYDCFILPIDNKLLLWPTKVPCWTWEIAIDGHSIHGCGEVNMMTSPHPMARYIQMEKIKFHSYLRQLLQSSLQTQTQLYLCRESEDLKRKSFLFTPELHKLISTFYNINVKSLSWFKFTILKQ